MRSFQVPGQTTANSPKGLQPGEKRRLVAMAIGTLLLLGAFLYSRMRQEKYEDTELQDLPTRVAMQESVLLPEIDASKLDELTSDQKRLDRVVLETPALDLLLEDARRLTPHRCTGRAGVRGGRLCCHRFREVRADRPCGASAAPRPGPVEDC